MQMVLMNPPAFLLVLGVMGLVRMCHNPWLWQAFANILDT